MDISAVIDIALKEDLADGGDITSAYSIPDNANAHVAFVSRENGVLAGVDIAKEVFAKIDPAIVFNITVQDGENLSKGQTIATAKGNARAILTAERTALNFMTHLSGIASITADFVALTADTRAKIYDTRKTLPALRDVQKYAVRMGGGQNHRMGLYDQVLIKDNHIASAGSVEDVLNGAAQNVSADILIEIEVDTLDQLQRVLDHKSRNTRGADIILLDNMDIKTLKQAVEMGRTAQGDKIILEASGGITIKTAKDIAHTGVDRLSIGALTHSVRALDIGLDIELKK